MGNYYSYFCVLVYYCFLYYCAALWCEQIIGNIIARWSYSFVFTLHFLIFGIMHAYRKVLNFRNVCQVHSVECVSKIKSILSIIFHAIYAAAWFSFPILLWWLWEYVNFMLSWSTEVWANSHCLGLGHETLVCTVFISAVLSSQLQILAH